MVAPGYHPLVRKQFEQVRCQQLARTRRRRRADRGLGMARLHCVDDRSRVLHIRLAVLQPDLRNCRRTRQPLELGAHARRSARHEYVLELDGCCAAEHVSSERLGAFGLLLKAQIGTGLPAEVGVLAREVHDHAMQLVSVSHDSPTARTAGPSPPWVAAYGASVVQPVLRERSLSFCLSACVACVALLGFQDDASAGSIAVRACAREGTMFPLGPSVGAATIRTHGLAAGTHATAHYTRGE